MAACNQRKKKEEEGNKTVIAGFLFESRSGDRREARKEGREEDEQTISSQEDEHTAGRQVVHCGFSGSGVPQLGRGETLIPPDN